MSSMSRKPLAASTATTSRSAVVRAPSSNNLSAMPPPSKLPSKALGVSTSSNKVNSADGANSKEPSRPTSPNGRDKENKRIVGGGNGVGNGKGITKAMMEKPPSSPDENGEMNIQVVVRCRGRSAMEAAQRTPNIVTMPGQVSSAITIETGPLAGSSTSSTSAIGLPVSTSVTSSIPFSERAPVSKTYSFDKVFGPGADQTLVFKEVVENVLDEVIAGYNCTIFAYGQTGTGKTYTMQGDLSLTPLGTPVADAGIIPRVLHRLFAILDATPNAEYSVKCSYIELYNEELRDLLANDFHAPIGSVQPMGMNSAAGKESVQGLKIYEDQNKKGGVMIQGLEEAGVRNAKEGLALLKKGSERRQTAETNMNAHSSRSHSIMTLTVHMKETSIHGGEDLLKVGKLNLVDLAGSEAIGRSGAVEKRAREAGMINQSLLTLGRVITALVEKNSHVPYRESKLTRMLQDSLGGRTKTCIVATISPTKSNMEETLSTLDYAIRASAIRNKPEVNMRMTKGTLIKDYVNQIERMKTELMAAHEKNGGYYMTAERKQEIDDEMEDLKANLADATSQTDIIQRKHDTLTAEFEENMAMLLATEKDLQAAREVAAELKVSLEMANAELERVRVQLEEEKFVSEAYRQGEERIDKIATELKQVVRESVTDVGGLHAKIARKADVLTSNTDSANNYGQRLAALSDLLRGDISTLQTVQSGFGQTLQAELEAFAKRGSETLEQDKLFLDEQLRIFGGSMEVFQKSLETANRQTLEACAQSSSSSSELKESMLSWMQRTRKETSQTIAALTERQRLQEEQVEECIDHIADMLDVVLDGAIEQTGVELRAALALKDQAIKAAEAQALVLQQQNERLTTLLQAERDNSAKLRDNLIAQIGGLLSGFTAAQDQSLSQAVATVQKENEVGTVALSAFVGSYSNGFAVSTQRSEQYTGDLSGVRQAAAGQRAESKDTIKAGLADHAQAMRGFETNFCASVEAANKDIGRRSALVADSIASTSAAIHTAGESNKQSVVVLEGQVKETYAAAKERLITAKEDIKLVSTAVLTAHASSEPMFAEHCQMAQNRLKDITHLSTNFVSDLKEDMATGSTPRKKMWNVPSKWSNTAPRAMLVEGFRRKRFDGLDVIDPEHGKVEIETVGTPEFDSQQTAGPSGPSTPTTPQSLADERSENQSLQTSTSTVASEAPPVAPPVQHQKLQAPAPLKLKPAMSRSMTGTSLEDGAPASSIPAPARKVKRNV